MNAKLITGTILLSVLVICNFLSLLKIQIPFEWIIYPLLFSTGNILILTGLRKTSDKQEELQVQGNLEAFEEKYGKLSGDTRSLETTLPKIVEINYANIFEN
ncbi:MAG: hypothetical protein WCF93_00960 [Candidatus Moraniibacteriota bacterium]